jgi:transcriptional regulator with XRE-family HTH domain
MRERPRSLAWSGGANVAYRTKEQILDELRRLKEEHGASQEELAAVLGVAQSSVSRLLNGERGLTAAELAGLAEFFGVSVDSILRDADEVVVYRGDKDDPALQEALRLVDDLIDNYVYFKALVP